MIMVNMMLKAPQFIWVTDFGAYNTNSFISYRFCKSTVVSAVSFYTG